MVMMYSREPQLYNKGCVVLIIEYNLSSEIDFMRELKIDRLWEGERITSDCDELFVQGKEVFR